jgi:predicted AlkP superfamily phosphohydrolase/phosphomutase
MKDFNRKVLVIGIDGATWKTLDEIINGNHMPYLQKLLKNSSKGNISSTIPPISPAAWGTIQSGKDAISNNIYEFYCFNKDSKDFEIVNSNFLKNDIWEILSKVKKKISVVNVPMTYPPKKVNGQIIAGILTPSLESEFTYPRHLKKKLLNRIPDYQLKYSEDVRYGNPHNDIIDFINKRIKNIKDRTKVCVWLLNNFKTDILMVNFQANDILQHALWSYMDEESPSYDVKIKKMVFKKFYKTLDFCIEVIREEFLRNSPGNLMTMFLSDHGCELHRKRFYLGNWLYENGFLKIQKISTHERIKNLTKKFILGLNILNFQVKMLNFLRGINLKLFQEDKTVNPPEMGNIGIDWNKSLAVSMGISLYGLIFILDKKRKEKIEKNLIKKLKKIKDNENNKKIVDKIYKTNEIYKGNSSELLPDLIVKPIKSYSFTGSYKKSKEKIVKINKKFDFATGKHSEEGILIIHGESIVRKKIKEAKLSDITPTILSFFNLPVKEHNFSGKSLNIFKQ